MEDKRKVLVRNVFIAVGLILAIVNLKNLIFLLISGDVSLSVSSVDFKRIVVVSVVLGIPLYILVLLNYPEVSFKRAVIGTVLIVIVFILGGVLLSSSLN